jgi:hypothetical protein
MKLFLINIFKFTCAFSICFITLLFVTCFDNFDKKHSNNHNILSLNNVADFDSLDILFVGNSYTYSSIKPSLFDLQGLKTYNLGIATAGVDFYNLVINDYIDNTNPPPKKVFILLSPMTFSKKSDNFSMYPIHRYINNPISHLEMALNFNREKKLITLYRKSMKKAFSNIKYLFASKVENNFQDKGFYFSDMVFDRDSIDTKPYITLFHETFDNNKIRKIEDLTSNLYKKKVEVVFYELPTNHLERFFNYDYLFSYNCFLNNLSNSFPLLKVNKLLFNEDNYRDIDHMNDSGANLATKQIIHYIKTDTLGISSSVNSGTSKPLK